MILSVLMFGVWIRQPPYYCWHILHPNQAKNKGVILSLISGEVVLTRKIDADWFS